MQRNKLTFNDLPEVVGELCERISSMENLLTEKLHQQHNEVKKDTHVPMTDRKSTRLNSSHGIGSRMPSSA